MKGFVMVPDGWLDSGLDDGAFRLLCLLARYALDDGTCHLGTAELAAVLKVLPREIRRRLHTLEAAGMIRREYQGPAKRNLRGIVVPGAKVIGRGHAATPKPGSDEPPTTVHRDRRRRSTVTVDDGPDRPSICPNDGPNVPSIDGPNGPPPLKREERPIPERLRTESSRLHADEPAKDSNGEPIDLDCGEAPDPGELNRLALWADEKFGSVYWGSQVRMYAKTYPLGWIRMVVEDAGTWARPPFNFQPLLNKLRLWSRTGGPPATATVPFARPAAPAKQKNRTEQLLEELDRRIAAQEAT